MARIGGGVNPLAAIGSPTVGGQNRKQARSRVDARRATPRCRGERHSACSEKDTRARARLAGRRIGGVAKITVRFLSGGGDRRVGCKDNRAVTNPR